MKDNHVEDNHIRIIDAIEKLEEILEEKGKTIFLLKHSTQCPISASAKEQFEAFAIHYEDKKEFFFCIVNVIESRNISSRVEDIFRVKHESPQLFIIKNKKVLFHTSHDDITLETLEENILDQ